MTIKIIRVDSSEIKILGYKKKRNKMLPYYPFKVVYLSAFHWILVFVSRSLSIKISFKSFEEAKNYTRKSWFNASRLIQIRFVCICIRFVSVFHCACVALSPWFFFLLHVNVSDQFQFQAHCKCSIFWRLMHQYHIPQTSPTPKICPHK